MAPSGFLARAEFETVADVTGREFSIGIVRVSMTGGTSFSDLVNDTLTTTSAIRFNANPSPDFDGDGTVGFSDFLAFASGFGTQQGDAGYDARYDLDGDGDVGFSDFLIFAGAFGSQVPPSGAGATVNIADANLRAVIADSLGKASGAPITGAEMATLTRIDAPNKKILHLTGLEHAANLKTLNLGRARVNGVLVNSNVLSNLSPLSNLTNLTYLDLTSNRISDISALSDLTNLTELHLGGNETISDISALSNLTKLTRLNLWDNRISDMSALGSLSNLTHLSLSGNELDGAIPSELGNLTNLEVLYLWGNELNGAIPSELGNLTNLTVLDLGDNELNGAIPSELGNLTNLEELSLWGNELNGAIPSELGNLTNLTVLDLGDNELNGAIPSELGNLTNLDKLHLTRNELNGAIPSELGNLTNLTVLALGGNELNGAIPSELGNLTNLEELYLWGNELDGAIPSELGNLTNLTKLWINNNAALTGSLPQSLTNLTKLEIFHFDGTGLCAPLDAAFQTWLQGIKNAEGPNCSGTSPPSGSPDLIVESPSVDDSTLTTGQSFTLRATVRNQGNASSAATTLRYYRSSNATISTDDTEVGTDAVSTLSAGGTSAESISLNAPSSAGTYHYGACVDPVSGESNTDNNCSGTRVTVAQPTTDVYRPLAGLRVSNGRVEFLGSSAGQCIVISNSTVNNVRYTTHKSKWQRKAGTSWVDVAGTERDGLCSYSPTSAGEYRLVAEITIDGVRGKYASENTLTVGSTPQGDNRQPVAGGAIAAQSLTVGGAAATVDVSGSFSDPDGDALTFSAVSSDTSVAAVSALNSMVEITPKAAGSATVTVTATDPGGLSAEQTIDVAVAQPTTDVYRPLAGLRVSVGRVQYLFFSSGQCIVISNSSINNVRYTTHKSKWQRKAGTSWVDVAGTERDGLCAYSPTSAGEYRLVAEITINGVRGKYASENTLTVG